jgi:hypothetical protein
MCPVLSCHVMLCPVLSCPLLSCPVLLCPVYLPACCTDPDVEPHVDGVNALLIAVDGGHEDIVRLLLGRAGD